MVITQFTTGNTYVPIHIPYCGIRMKYAELTRKLQRLGCYCTRYGAGSHEIWRNPDTGIARDDFAKA